MVEQPKTAVKTAVAKKKINLKDKPVVNTERWLNLFERFYNRLAENVMKKIGDDELVDIVVESISGDEARNVVREFAKGMRQLPALLKHTINKTETLSTQMIQKFEGIRKRMDADKTDIFGRIDRVEKKMDKIIKLLEEKREE